MFLFCHSFPHIDEAISNSNVSCEDISAKHFHPITPSLCLVVCTRSLWLMFCCLSYLERKIRYINHDVMVLWRIKWKWFPFVALTFPTCTAHIILIVLIYLIMHDNNDNFCLLSSPPLSQLYVWESFEFKVVASLPVLKGFLFCVLTNGSPQVWNKCS